MKSMSERPDADASANRHLFTDAQAGQSVDQRSEEIHVRNFDVRRSYDLTIEVRDDQGLVFANRYHLTPGKTVSELDRLSPGEYEVRVQLDGRRDQTTVCEIGESPAQTALVEVGNGTVSVTEGLYH
jgi:sarcosine oxidase gamma subunit